MDDRIEENFLMEDNVVSNSSSNLFSNCLANVGDLSSSKFQNEYDNSNMINGPASAACINMCSMSEFNDRKQSKIFSIFETDRLTQEFTYELAVKEYRRSAAGETIPKPSDMRTKDTLVDTMKHIIDIVSKDDRGSWDEWYDFLWSRTRAIRKEINQLRIDEECSYRILQAIIKFHLSVHCMFQSKPRSLGINLKLNEENLTACFIDLFSSNTFKNSKKLMKTSFLYISYFILLNLNHPLDLNLYLKKMYNFEFSADFYGKQIKLFEDFFIALKCFDVNSVYRIVDLEFNKMQKCAVSPFIAHFRYSMLQRIIISFRNKTNKIGLQFIAQILGINIETLEKRLQNFNNSTSLFDDKQKLINLSGSILKIFSLDYFLSFSYGIDKKNFKLSNIISFDDDGFFDINQQQFDYSTSDNINIFDKLSYDNIKNDNSKKTSPYVFESIHKSYHFESNIPSQELYIPKESKFNPDLSIMKEYKKNEVFEKHIKFNSKNLQIFRNFLIKGIKTQYLNHIFKNLKLKYHHRYIKSLERNNKIQVPIGEKSDNIVENDNTLLNKKSINHEKKHHKHIIDQKMKIFKLKCFLKLWYNIFIDNMNIKKILDALNNQSLKYLQRNDSNMYKFESKSHEDLFFDSEKQLSFLPIQNNGAINTSINDLFHELIIQESLMENFQNMCLDFMIIGNPCDIQFIMTLQAFGFSIENDSLAHFDMNKKQIIKFSTKNQFRYSVTHVDLKNLHCIIPQIFETNLNINKIILIFTCLFDSKYDSSLSNFQSKYLIFFFLPKLTKDGSPMIYSNEKKIFKIFFEDYSRKCFKRNISKMLNIIKNGPKTDMSIVYSISLEKLINFSISQILAHIPIQSDKYQLMNLSEYLLNDFSDNLQNYLMTKCKQFKNYVARYFTYHRSFISKNSNEISLSLLYYADHIKFEYLLKYICESIADAIRQKIDKNEFLRPNAVGLNDNIKEMAKSFAIYSFLDTNNFNQV